MKRILIVDDEPDVIQVIEVRLKAAGYEIQTAMNGEDALKKINQKHPDLVILDVVMPQMDGFAAYKQLRTNKDTARIPIIILTARGKMEDTFQVLGVDEFIPKPFDMNRLLAAIERLLKVSIPAQPVKAEAPVTPAAATTSAVSAAAPAASSILYLLAGHSSDLLNKTIALIKARKGEVVLVQSEAEVISKMATLKPKAIILDLYLGDTSAEDMIRNIRVNPAFKKTPIILYSYIDSKSLGGDSLNERAMSIDTAKDNCLSAGATEYAGGLSDKDFERNLVRLL